VSAEDEPRTRALHRADLAPTWHEQLAAWLVEAEVAAIPEPTAMVLATADANGAPSARTVLLKGLSPDGLVFYTNLDSRKGRDIEANPRAAAVFPWIALGRQVIAGGSVVPVEDATADAYYASRPYGSQISAHVSRQSSVVASREELEAAHAAARARYPEGEPVPRPARWSGLRIVPDSVEFWQIRPDRLHDRLRFRWVGESDAWTVERLAP
jgi:pyridoxamine 5'-phosphate oxidase